MGKTGERAPSVFLGIQEIAGYYSNLEQGLNEIGVTARLVTTRPHPFEYGQAQANPAPAEFAANAVRAFRRNSGIVLWWYAFLFILGSIGTLFWAIPRFNTFVFGWGMSLLPGNVDIVILRLFGKKVISVMGHGSEARPPYMSTPPEAVPLRRCRTKQLAGEVRRIARRVRRQERWSTVCIGMLTTAQFFTKPFVDFYYVGLPTPPRHHDVGSESNTEFTILHLPSNKAVKGTEHIRRAVEEVQRTHADVKYIELSGVSHAEAMEAMNKATLVVDWLWSDIPMAVVGTEAASFGTPTVISGFAWKQWDAWEKKNPGMRPPAFYATPETLGGVIEKAVTERANTVAVGQRAKDFVTTVWSREQVARNFLHAINGTLPAQAYLTPADVDYAWGAGVSQEDVTTMVGDLVRYHGLTSLRWDRASEVYGLDG